MTKTSPFALFRIFLLLGLTSFGGPTAHIAFFRTAFVEKRRWFSDADFAELVALCQFLPGPASSQLGFAIGLFRGGYLGALFSWIAFTLPSAIVLVLFAYLATDLQGPLGQGLVHGLKLAAVAVVLRAVWSMARGICTDAARIGIALLALAITLAWPESWAQLVVICIGALLGKWFCQSSSAPIGHELGFSIGRASAFSALTLHLLLLIALPVLAGLGQGVALADAFYRSGSLVFGGGHVVLPLIEAEVVPRGWISADTFVQGYAAAQAVPGPLFTFATYIGALVTPSPNGVLGAAIATLAIFLPGMLILLAALPFWNQVRRIPNARAAIAGVSAAVVGLLAAAAYRPVWTSAVSTGLDVALSIGGVLLLSAWKWPAWAVVLCVTAAAVLLVL
ncbi:chromate efflux transporter [Pseudomonas matsuisoli]|uniref:Chromate transporter n=1 Tax=Pseudomonas matsuisoli TaxID=1515666 RepID=A0A917PUT7_9PSED|nr:chromate efflux transporter [Pseudomonas matsuisoli]GGJ92632.1 chromate transporter [Pseudomonas matsuisoli]